MTPEQKQQQLSINRNNLTQAGSRRLHLMVEMENLQKRANEVQQELQMIEQELPVLESLVSAVESIKPTKPKEPKQ